MDVVLARPAPGRTGRRAPGALALGLFEGEGRGAARLAGLAAEVDRRSGGAIAALMRSRDFTGRTLELALLHPRRAPAGRVILVGLGRRADLDRMRLRQAAALVARRARELRAGVLRIALPAGPVAVAEAAQAAAEGAVLGHYRHDAYRSEPTPPALRRIEIAAGDDGEERALATAVARGARFGEATALARDLARTPGEDLTPELLGRRAAEIARASGARCRVLGVPELERLGTGALLAVGRGSQHPPRLIVLERAPGAGAPRGARRARGARRVPTVVLIGKGITFDSGGLSLKPTDSMVRMKYDMSGAAAVLGAFSALPEIAPPFRVVGLVPAAENMPGGRALKPGDVVRALGGTTIEITNTDAEGRLVLADALGYAARYEPEAVVDLATLTGAISIALGFLAAGLFTADESLARELAAASEASGERLWRMPLWEDYAQALRSDTADLVNSAGREGGAAIAAAFLQRFARGMRWAHLDIASTAWSPAERPHETRGPTGFGARLLLEWLSARAASVSASPPRGARPRAGARRAGR